MEQLSLSHNCCRRQCSGVRICQLLNPCATAAQAHVSQLLKPVLAEPVLCNKKATSEKPMHRNKE